VCYQEGEGKQFELYCNLQVVAVPPLGPNEAAGATVPLTINPALLNPAANPALIQAREPAAASSGMHAPPRILALGGHGGMMSAATCTPVLGQRLQR
jgi:hypothetical protein